MPHIMLPNNVFMLIKLGTITESNGSLTIGDLEAHEQMQERFWMHNIGQAVSTLVIVLGSLFG